MRFTRRPVPSGKCWRDVAVERVLPQPDRYVSIGAGISVPDTVRFVNSPLVCQSRRPLAGPGASPKTLLLGLSPNRSDWKRARLAHSWSSEHLLQRVHRGGWSGGAYQADPEGDCARAELSGRRTGSRAGVSFLAGQPGLKLGELQGFDFLPTRHPPLIPLPDPLSIKSGPLSFMNDKPTM